MIYTTGYYYAPRYEYTNSNQHGDRFKRVSSKRINMVKLACKRDNASDLENLIILGHTLDVPVHYDFENNQAYIEIMSADKVRE